MSSNKNLNRVHEESKIFASTRNHSIDKNDLLTERDSSPFPIHSKKDKKDGVSTCRKPIILKGNLPSVFDIDKLNIIKRNDGRRTGSFYDKHRTLLKTAITSNQINDLFTNQSNVTNDNIENKPNNDYNDLSKKEPSYDSRKTSLNKMKRKSKPFNIDSKKIRDKTKSSMNINYFNSTNDHILINNDLEKLKISYIENSFSKSINKPKFSNNSTSHKHCSILVDNDKNNQRKRNIKAIQIHKAEIERPIKKDSYSFAKIPSNFKIKNYMKYNLDPKTIKRIFTKTPPSITELSLIKNNPVFDKVIRLEDIITLSIINSDSKSRMKKVFSVVNFEVIIVKV